MQRIVLLWVGVMLACLGVVLSLPATGFEVPSALTGADGGRVANWGNAPQQPDDSYALMPAEEDRETDKRPVNTSLLTMLLLLVASCFGASVGWLARNAWQRGVISSSDVDRRSLATAREGLSFLGVFRL